MITDPVLARDLDSSAASRATPEKLLIREDDDGVGVALYLDRELVDRLGEDDPHDALHDGNLADFCTVLEGVSHFLYFTWNAEHDRGVSLLELEMQAEVDKYVSTALLFGHQARGRVPIGLHGWLFDEPSFDAGLDEEELHRYRSANYYAGRFCARLQSRYLRERPRAGMMNELRRFYRLTRAAKIQAAQCA